MIAQEVSNFKRITQKKRTLRLVARDPLMSVVVVTSEVVADSWVDAAVVVQFTVHNVRQRTALRWNGCGVVTFIETSLHYNDYTHFLHNFIDIILYLQTKLRLQQLPHSCVSSLDVKSCLIKIMRAECVQNTFAIALQ